MNDIITVRGYVATEVNLRATQNGDSQASFRMVCTDRILDRETGNYVDGHSNWFGIYTYRYLAQNTAFSVHRGDRILVTGRLKVRQWTNEQGRSGTNVDIEADSLGHDLRWGVAKFKRTNSSRANAAASQGEDGQGAEESGGEEADNGLEAAARAGDVPENVDPDTGEILESEDRADGGQQEVVTAA